MGKVKSIIRLFLLCILMCILTSCSPQKEDDISQQKFSVEESFVEESSSFVFLEFDNEKHFLDVVQEVKLKKKERDDQAISIKTRDGMERLYSAISDSANLDSISEYYRPIRPPKDTKISNVIAEKSTLAFYYSNEKDTTYSMFVWDRAPMPEEAINELFGRGAVSEGKKEYNGVEYIIFQWPGMKEGEKGNYNIWWKKDGKAFNASFSPDFTEEEMLDFCQFETVTVKEK